MRGLGPRARHRCTVAVVLACVLALSGCGPGGFNGLYNVPLPGGADLGDHPYVVKAEFANVLNLVPQAMVKKDDVPVGKVDRIELEKDNKTALVTMTVNDDVSLPANATAGLRQSSLLGEKYVALSTPAHPVGKLGSGATIPKSRTDRNASVEEVLGALSLLLNNGGIERLQSITRELNAAFGGREPQLRATLQQVRTLVGQLNAQRDDIVHAIDSVNKLSKTVADQRNQIANGLDSIDPGIKIANQQRGQLVTMLNSLHKLSDTATGTIQQSRSDILADLHELEPTLRNLAKSGQNIPKALQILLSYPFSNHAMTAIKGDYGNADFILDFRLDKILKMLQRSKQPLLPLERLTGDQTGQPSTGQQAPQHPPPAGAETRVAPAAPQPQPGGSGGQPHGVAPGTANGANGDTATGGGTAPTPGTGQSGGGQGLNDLFGTLLGGGA